MSAVSLRIPDSIHRRIREMAEQEGVSINQLITSALVEKLSALRAQEYLEERAGRGSRSRFDAVLAKVRDVAPVKGDEPGDAKPARPRTRTPATKAAAQPARRTR